MDNSDTSFVASAAPLSDSHRMVALCHPVTLGFTISATMYCSCQPSLDNDINKPYFYTVSSLPNLFLSAVVTGATTGRDLLLQHECHK